MSVWWWIPVGLFAWTVVSVAFGLLLGRVVSRQRRGGYIAITHRPVGTSITSTWPTTGSDRAA